ncbi:hypothetical protein [Gracilimonas mengyeensis]|uniref:Polysaccharide deacetylase n=1 Tax=Gracilimonas mengyeensis TaxID=1302730 RepID=A0A521DGW3_9BACT|nr:hypothetical protein [Gracilimonas mengyeensis]SMO70822.1 hypothetical protein SAMN06265219_108160 [Gracilimonas mengyeensis]
MFKPSDIFIFLIVIAFTFVNSCHHSVDEEPQIKILGITKWYNNYKSALSVTHDSGYPISNDIENSWLYEHQMFMDYEIISDRYVSNPKLVEYLKEKLIPNGFGYFGHGHTHINHDQLSYEEAYKSFRKDAEHIKAFGLNPIAYAYPGGYGFEDSTQFALKKSGYLSGRLFQKEFEGRGPYIMSGDQMAPENWYALPSLPMQDFNFDQCERCINNHDEFLSYLNESVGLESWLISTYHSIGFDGKTDGRPEGWGYYTRENFYKDMLAIKELREKGKVWLANMSDVTIYTYLRNQTTYELKMVNESQYKLMLETELPIERFNHDLSLEISIAENSLGKTLTIEQAEKQITQKKLTKSKVYINLRPSKDYFSIYVE